MSYDQGLDYLCSSEDSFDEIVPTADQLDIDCGSFTKAGKEAHLERRNRSKKARAKRKLIGDKEMREHQRGYRGSR